MVVSLFALFVWLGKIIPTAIIHLSPTSTQKDIQCFRNVFCYHVRLTPFVCMFNKFYFKNIYQ